MKDARLAWESGDTLILQGRAYRVESLVGMGSNAIVYKVCYMDGMSPQSHIALLKELYPSVEGVTRIRGELTVSDAAAEAFALHKRSFLRGNEAHLRQLRLQAGRVSGNLDSFSANGTLYTLLNYHTERTLKDLTAQPNKPPVERSARRMLSVLDALAPFHESGLLHLDVSPDNILVLPELRGYEADCEPMLLIDYNGVWDRAEQNEPCLSSKAGYTSPEARLGDANALGPATDLFSACAVFFEMLTGRSLRESECCGQFISRVCAEVETACESLPHTARQQAVRIIRKGLQPLPARRFQTIDELREAVRELLNRIFGKGVTHAALWEAAKKSLPDNEPPKRPIALALTISGPDGAKAPLTPAADARPLLVRGGGGSGKTTLFKAIHRQYSQRYRLDEPVCYYIPLFRWQGRVPFLMDCLSEYLLPENDAQSATDVNAALALLLSKPLYNGKPCLILLLDGLNEAGVKSEGLLREIRAVASLGGVRILVSSRDAADLRRLPDGFSLATLEPPQDAEVNRFLTENNLTSVTTPSVRAMLTCPLVMQYYADIWEAWRQSGKSLLATNPDFSTPDALRRGYMESQLARYESLHRESETDCLRARYAMEHLLPALAAEMRRRPALTQNEAVAVVNRAYRALRGKAFSKAYPAYLGMTRRLLCGIRDAWEWYDLTVREVLGNQLALLRVQHNGEVALCHESFREVLALEAKRLSRRLRAQSLKKAGVAVACACLLLGIAAAARPLFPSGLSKTEQATVQNLENAGLSALLDMSETIKAQASVRDALANGEGTPRIDALLPASVTATDLDTVPWAKAKLDRAAWETLLQAPGEVSRLYLGGLLALSEGFDGTHSAAYQAERLALYDEFCQKQKTYDLMTLYAVFNTASQDFQDQFYQAMKASAGLRDTFVQTAKPQGGAADLQAQRDAALAALTQTVFDQLAQNEAEKWPDAQAMLAELRSRLKP